MSADRRPGSRGLRRSATDRRHAAARYPGGVTDALTKKKAQVTTRPTLVRRATAVVLGATLGSLAVPALATPESWTDPDNPSLMGSLILIGAPVLAIIAILTLLTYLPSMMGRGGSGDLSYNDPEWFGGPRTGVRTDAETPTDTGGSGGRW